ncbi:MULTISPECIES: exonuclease subunit SbcD [Okeania]|uniref:Nuclease SbcCD subunit D n=1 Tax=Okeania hirsuta TaxID=1458930 RepID=A0A3N6PC58_9CYAN|nr:MULTISPECIES: exonuclease SbcCD subunit D [Okeania]NES89792.1 exonuclease SbcCD subunit D [Okeania sp. SIO2B9]NET79784.1 exonuclease SbcCD subunit D [Okeania sp. SIO1F9]RQH43517.1 exonuclease SbcCD subunit D [Okeania hirsuta]
MIKIIHLSDIHIGSGFSHGRINPETGLNTRLEDFISSLKLCIDRAISEPVDLVIFGGDAFPDATPAPYIKQAFSRELRRLVDAEIPTVLLVGNHDQHSQGQGGASLGIYSTLGVPGVVVGDRLETHNIQTKSGAIQIITLPWLTASSLMTKSETESLSMGKVNELLIEKLKLVLEAEIRQLNPEIPTVLLAHLMADRASLGAERFLAVGKGFNIPVSLLNRDCFDYVALGHVHKHQNLNKSNNPPIIYPGSIERVDFSEEKEEKGFVLLELEKGAVKWEFCSLPVRNFYTIKVNVSEAENPQAELLKSISKTQIKDAVVRLIYQLRSEQLDLIENGVLHQALSEAHTYTIQPELVSQLARPRLPELAKGNSIDPLKALKTYLESREDIQDIQEEMLEAAAKLLSDGVDSSAENSDSQLSLFSK